MRLHILRRTDRRGTSGFKLRDFEILRLDPTTGQWSIVRQGDSAERPEQPRSADSEQRVLAALAAPPPRRLDAPTIRLG